MQPQQVFSSGGTPTMYYVAQPTQVSQPGADQQIILQLPPAARSYGGQTYSNYKSRTSVILGSLHIVFGIMGIGFNVASICVNAWGAVVSYGIWGGVFYIINGTICIVAARARTYSMVSSVMGLSIVSCLMATTGFVMATIGAAEDSYYWYRTETMVAMGAMLALVSAAELAVAIWSAILGGVACCPGGDCGGPHCEKDVLDPCCEPCYTGSQQPVVCILNAGFNLVTGHVQQPSNQYIMTTINGQQCLVPANMYSSVAGAGVAYTAAAGVTFQNVEANRSTTAENIPANNTASSTGPTTMSQGTSNAGYEDNESNTKIEAPPAYSEAR